MLRVLIADDHFKVRQGLRAILQEGPETMVVGEAKTGHEAVEQARAASWDVVLLDINLPDQSGMDVLRQLKQERPGRPVLLLSLHPGAQYLKGSLKAGASGFLSKESAPEELKNAIHTVLAGGIYVSRALAGE
jgi:two-component system, NarL family, invasion response regulator UvrY